MIQIVEIKGDGSETVLHKFKSLQDLKYDRPNGLFFQTEKNKKITSKRMEWPTLDALKALYKNGEDGILIGKSFDRDAVLVLRYRPK